MQHWNLAAIGVLSSTLKQCAEDMIGFSLVFFIIFAAYSMAAYIFFGKYLTDYKTFVTTLESLMAMLLGSFDYIALKSAQAVIAPMFFLSFVVVNMFIVLNMFLSIINDTLNVVKTSSDKQGDDYLVTDYILDLIGFGGSKGQDIKVQDHINTEADDSSKIITFLLSPLIIAL